ncbi:hypothetical protein VPH35_008941 [Triticum aestivum]
MVEELWSNSPLSAKRMAEASWSNSPPSAKHHRGEASGKEQLVVDDDVPVPGQKRDYTVPLKVDIHLKEPLDVRKWRVPNNGKKWQSLAEFAGSLIHPSYKEMKQKIDRKSDHLLWGYSPLLNNLIEYAAKDAYVTYEAWKKIEITKEGLELWQEAEDHWDDPYY